MSVCVNVTKTSRTKEIVSRNVPLPHALLSVSTIQSLSNEAVVPLFWDGKPVLCTINVSHDSTFLTTHLKCLPHTVHQH